jgi:hypothetical protein
MQSVDVITVIYCKNFKELGRVIDTDMLENVSAFFLLKIQ